MKNRKLIKKKKEDWMGESINLVRIRVIYRWTSSISLYILQEKTGRNWAVGVGELLLSAKAKVSLNTFIISINKVHFCNELIIFFQFQLYMGLIFKVQSLLQEWKHKILYLVPVKRYIKGNPYLPERHLVVHVTKQDNHTHQHPQKKQPIQTYNIYCIFYMWICLMSFIKP